MKRFYLLALGLTLLGFHGATFAQVHPCAGPSPTEEVVGSQPGGNGVAPVPLCRTVSGSGDTSQPGRTLGSGVTYGKTWGAIATSHDAEVAQRAIGIIVNQPSRADAEQKALSLCESAHGSTPCKVNLSFENGCGALAYATTDLYAQSVTTDRMPVILGGDPTRELLPKAEQAALDACTKGGGHDCKVLYKVCSGPAVRKSKSLLGRLFHSD